MGAHRFQRFFVDIFNFFSDQLGQKASWCWREGEYPPAKGPKPNMITKRMASTTTWRAAEDYEN